MRTSGVSTSGRGFGVHDHVCWSYDDHADFLARAVEFLTEGLHLGLRTAFVAPGAADELRAQLSRAEPLARALADGALTVESLDGVYGPDEVVDPETQVAAYAAATEAALAQGFRGYRVAAEATALVRTPRQLEQFTRYEHRVDRYMVTHPFSALCAYRRDELDPSAVAQLAGLHPAASPDATPFRLHAGSDGTLTLAGELDFSSAETFPLVLERAGLPGGRVVIDGHDLEFVDHRSLWALADAAARRDATVVLRTGHPGVERLLGLLDVPRVTVERTA
ncbi:anti-anti-sigma regulatory factor [Amycolatopsis bartoniae]|nr:MEDS domain-containing protein [Amycolatopsis bartoniae]MBB2936056.1 anti-anti-sigma regulatory factor [Amycolatopsis bartoniae]TVT03545.1 STAS domain-containing protein [Amycolatopsis bartoniae]